MPGFWIYSRVLNIPGLWIFQDYTNFWICLSTFLLHCLTCVVPFARGLHYFIITLTLGVEWPMWCGPILSYWCFEAFNFQIISFAFQPCLPGTTPRITTSYNCLVYLFWPCVWIHMLKITVPTKTSKS